MRTNAQEAVLSLAFIKLGIDKPEAVIPRAFVENHALVPKTSN
jgi:hypothetical protein